MRAEVNQICCVSQFLKSSILPTDILLAHTYSEKLVITGTATQSSGIEQRFFFSFKSKCTIKYGVDEQFFSLEIRVKLCPPNLLTTVL